ncbi:hypothetical protein LAZ67_7001545 [Cordylochernes scorpioides]|uniref:Transposable element Tc1 transposase n=1 Tax=Cordylochernes scorpioides TaxID=51811 RepID=A0ABY6KPC2_9ARAC|nr:hypothetical protein LAZ67_7001545 [Cordylochernes scorpioides]
MPGHRKRRQFKQTDAFTRGMVIGLKRAGQIKADTHLGSSTVHRLWRRWLEQGNVEIYRNVGATRVTSAHHSISTRTISRRLVANGLHSCRPLRRLPLTPPNRRRRLEWCRARSTWMTEWHRVVFSDESRFCLSSDSRRVRVWRRRGERSNLAAIVERPTVRQRGIMVWGAIAYDSRSPLLRIQGTMTAQRYVDDVLRPVTLPYLQGVPNALYQQTNARPHTARISQQALQDVQMLPWPPYSPDLSPIEHVWDIIGRRLHALPQPRSEDELWQMVEREWRAIPQDAIRTLIDSLPRRVAACIATERRKLTLINQDLTSLEHIQIPRCVVPGKCMKVEFHGFCDASQKAYAASLYLEVILSNTSAKTFLLVAKTRVAPRKVVSLPKLEICSALLLARLVKTVYDNLPLTINEIYLWSDSTIALCWINSEPCRWKTFVANRVAEIHRLVSGVWCHVDGRQNPADCGIFPSDLVEHPLWWNGPPWLIEPALEIKKFINSSKKEFKEEEKIKTYFGTIMCEIPSIVINCSSLTKLKCIIAWCLRFVNNSRMPSHSRNREPLTLRELNDALLTVVKCVQSIEFSKEKHCLLSNKPIPNKSRIYNLCPFLDSRGIIRVGGRLKNVNVYGDRINRILLPRSHHITTLIVNNVHVHNLHSSTQATLAAIRNIFWIPSGRNVVRKILRTCMKCARFRKEAPFQLMGNLPFARINRSRRF